jgi:hypothetical protein
VAVRDSFDWRARSLESKARLVIAAIVLIGGCNRAGQTTQSDSRPATSISSPLPFTPSNFEFRHELPTVISDDRPTVTFEVPVLNRTDSAVKFERVSRSCSCTDAELRSNTVLAGEQTELNVTIRVAEREGPQRLLVTLADSTGRTWTYTLDFTIYPRARFPVDSFWLGSVDSQVRISRTSVFEVFSTTSSGLPDRVQFATSNESIQLTSGEAQAPVQLSDKIWVKRVPLSVAITAPTEPGPFHGDIRAEYLYRGKARQASAAISGSVRSLFEVAPQCVFFGTSVPESLSRRAIIRRTDGKPLTIEVSRVSHPDVTAKLETGKNDSAFVILSLTLDRKSKATPLWGEVILTTNDEKQSTIKIPLLPHRNQSQPRSRKEKQDVYP